MASTAIVSARPPAPKRGRTKAPILTPPEEMGLFEFLGRHPITIEQLAALTRKTPRAVNNWIANGDAPPTVRVLLHYLDAGWRWD
ncbi:MAG: XRE family transcriptional regulator [Spirulina sp. DLM2.Bin59]|nr:MAG: XRE family transcriptional regulator [Spirulina sp. DLM2.Bin59]